MAERNLVDVEAKASVSNAEVEQFRLERVAVKLFIMALTALVHELELKVSARNPVLCSMNRFLRTYGR